MMTGWTPTGGEEDREEDCVAEGQRTSLINEVVTVARFQSRDEGLRRRMDRRYPQPLSVVAPIFM